MSLRTLAVVPTACTSKQPWSMAPALRRTSGGWITGPAFVSATSTASTHGRVAGNSSLMRARAVLAREDGNTPTGRLAARTGAATVVTPVLRVR